MSHARTKWDYYLDVSRSAVESMRQNHERRMEIDPEYRARQKELERRYGEVFGARQMVDGDLWHLDTP